MSRWKRLLEQESEHQWLAFFGFTLIIILGSVVLDWSNDLSGVRDGSVTFTIICEWGIRPLDQPNSKHIMGTGNLP